MTQSQSKSQKSSNPMAKMQPSGPSAVGATVTNEPPREEDGTPFMPPIQPGDLPPNSPQAKHEGGYDFLDKYDPRRSTPRWLSGDELLSYISLAIVDLVEEWRPFTVNPMCLEALKSLSKQLRPKCDHFPHFHPMRSQPIAFLKVGYDVLEHDLRVIVSVKIELSTPEQKDLGPVQVTLDRTYWKDDVEPEIGEADKELLLKKLSDEQHSYSKTLSMDISRPNVARNRILQEQSEAVIKLTLEDALKIFRSKRVRGTSDWVAVNPVDGEPYVYSDRGNYSVNEAILIAQGIV